MSNLDKYQSLIKKQAKYYYDRTQSTCVDYMDFYQTACLILIEAEKSYQKSKGGFGPYLKSLLSQKLLDFSLTCGINLSCN